MSEDKGSKIDQNKINELYHINWDSTSDPNYVKKELVNAFRAKAKRVIIHVYNSPDYSYMEKLRNFLGEFLSQTIIIVRENKDNSMR
ncbi:hypothetical protein Calag_1409 [Caldisphaera lagunensis DSM 15908]|uniref:Uncharacterized protein n=1 Tax=Caldisphaera lagunensis (strain DSM 15908 / JCM 11604 / ANMR 0165 / IC-154) TaxID=1056495 RepID=L0AB79_CALLD|nr:hypothetical protein [Caldisphaera lagunensis]AFZ71116.1 hypothetical protein Calag_1409 [Caldisphaera lagunensis DSM 15908]